MRLSNGCWLPAPGVKTMFPTRVLHGEVVGAELHLQVIQPNGNPDSRLNGVATHLRVSASLAGCIRIEQEHWSEGGDESLLIPKPPGDPAAHAATTADGWQLTSGNVVVSVRQQPFQLSVLIDGRCVTACEELGPVQIDGAGYQALRLGLGAGETWYGFGERFTPFVRNGQRFAVWNEDGGTSCDQAYKNLPFGLSSAGYGLLLDHSGKIHVDIGAERTDLVQCLVAGERLAWTIVGGPTPKAVLGRLALLTGMPVVPPDWSFGLWLSTSFVTKYDATTVLGLIEGMQQRGIPLAVFHFDCFWMRERRWCDFEWDPATFPDPVGLLAKIKAKGVRTCLWINPYISSLSPLYAEAAAGGHLLKRSDGRVYQIDDWQPGIGIVDFTSPAATAWYQSHLARLLDQGVDCFKTDFGERIPADAVFANGVSGQLEHNRYAQRYNQAVMDIIAQRKGAAEAVVFARSAHAGCQRLPVHWGGDSRSTYASMAESLRGGLSFLLCGPAFWSHDIGGFGTFEQPTTPDIYKRWCAFGLLSSHSRLHGSNTPRVPWAFDEEAVAVLRRFTELKMRLLPSLLAWADEAGRSGVPLMRPMLLEFPADPASRTLDRQYMLGDALLVAPIMDPTGAVTYWLPEGRWAGLLDGTIRTGSTWQQEQHDYQHLPVLVRPGHAIALAPAGGGTTVNLDAGLDLVVGELPEGATATAVAADGRGRTVSIRITRQGNNLTAQPDAPCGPLRCVWASVGLDH